MISVETTEDVFERLHKQAEKRAARRRSSSRSRSRKDDSFSKTGAQQSTISKSPKDVRAFSVSSDERNPNAFEISINKPDKTNVFDRLHTTAKERTVRRKHQAQTNVLKSKTSPTNGTPPKVSLDRLCRPTRASKLRTRLESPVQVKSRNKSEEESNWVSNSKPFIAEVNKPCASVSKQRLHRVHRRLIADRRRDLDDLDKEFPTRSGTESVTLSNTKSVTSHLWIHDLQNQLEHWSTSNPSPDNVKESLQFDSSSSKGSEVPTLIDSSSESSFEFGSNELIESPPRTRRGVSFFGCPWRLTLSHKYTCRKLLSLDLDSLKLESAYNRFEKGLLDESAFAFELITAMFHRDFKQNKHWEICALASVEKESFSNGNVVVFQAEKKAKLDWKDVYSIASAKGTICFFRDLRQIHIEEYHFCVASRRFCFDLD